MIRCKKCGYPNRLGSQNCIKCNAPISFDVFISYSRKDYVDEKGHILPNNINSEIKKTFEENSISYWFDEDGIFTGDEFASVITKAIRMSQLFLFISSSNSNQSEWTSNEISTALVFRKVIIPFRLDNTPYNDSNMMKIVSFDYIECKDREKAIRKLLNAIWHHMPSTDRVSKVKSNFVSLPEDATRAKVFIYAGGKKTERIFSCVDGITKMIDERIIPYPLEAQDIMKTEERTSAPNSNHSKSEISQKALLILLFIAIVLFVLSLLF